MHDSDQTWISWEEASRLTGIRVPTIEHAVRVGRISRRPARGVLPTLKKDSVLAWAQWQREQVEQREARRREREDASAARRRRQAALRPADNLLGPPQEGSWLSLAAAAKRLDVTVATIRRWLDEGRLDGAQRAARWVDEASVDQFAAERRKDADTWISINAAQRIVGCSDLLIAKLVGEGVVVQRPGPRGQASINRASAEAAQRVLSGRREETVAARRRRDALQHWDAAPDDENVWLSVKTTAMLLGLSESGVTLRVRSGTLPAIRRGRRWWVRRQDAEQSAAARAFFARLGC